MTSLTVESDTSLDVISILRSCLSSSNQSSTTSTSSSSYSYFDSNKQPTTSLSQGASQYVLLSPHPNLISLDSVTRLASSTNNLQQLLTKSNSQRVKLTIPPFLSLRNILFAKEKENEPLGNYFRECAKEGFARLEALERNDILNWLNGKRQDWNGALEVDRVQWNDDEKMDQALPSTQTQPLAQTTDPSQTASATTQPSSTTAVKRTYVPNQTDQNFVKKLRTEKEVIIRDHNDVLHGSILNSSSSSSTLMPTLPSDSNSQTEILNGLIPTSSSGLSDFSSIRKSLYPKLETMRRSTFNKSNPSTNSKNSSRPTASSLNEPSSNPTSNNATKRSRRPLDPILLLSNSPTSLINIYNVKKFLEEGIFVEPDVARKQAGGVSEPVVSVMRTWGSTITSKTNPNSHQGGSGGGQRPLRFIVVDNAEILEKLGAATAGQHGKSAKDEAWDRVCVVFTTGQEWQFRQYHWQTGKELFKNVLGMYARWNNDDRNPIVRDWNVTELQVERSKRHTDKQLVAHFWRTVESWISRRKPQFAP